MSDTCYTQLRDTCNSIAAQIRNPPDVLEDDPTLVCEDEGYTQNEDGAWTNKDGEEVTTQTQSAYDYLSDVLDIEYRVGGDKQYRSAEILVSFGGPNIWINTQYNRVHGAWGSDSYSAPFIDNMGLDDVCEEMFTS